MSDLDTEYNDSLEPNGYDEDVIEATTDNPKEKIRVRRLNPLAGLKQALKEKIEKDPIELEIPQRKNIKLIFNTDLDIDLYTAYQRRATRTLKNKTQQLDEMKLASSILMHLSKGIKFDGVEVFDDQEKPMTLRSQELADDLGVISSQGISILRALYGYDGHIMIALRDVMEASGYGDDIDLEDEDDDFPNSMNQS